MSDEKKLKKHNSASGKTRFNSGKAKGESWTVRRDKAIADGTFRMEVKNG